MFKHITIHTLLQSFDLIITFIGVTVLGLREINPIAIYLIELNWLYALTAKIIVTICVCYICIWYYKIQPYKNLKLIPIVIGNLIMFGICINNILLVI
jgi:hypothetical protein